MNQFSENLKASCKFLQEKRRRYSSVLRRIFSALKYLLFHCLCSGVVCQLHNISISIAHQAMALSSSSSANLFDPAIAHIWTWKVAVLPWRCLLEDGVNLKRKYWHAVLSPFEKCICSGSPLLDWWCFNLRRRLHAHRFYACAASARERIDLDMGFQCWICAMLCYWPAISLQGLQIDWIQCLWRKHQRL